MFVLPIQNYKYKDASSLFEIFIGLKSVLKRASHYVPTRECTISHMVQKSLIITVIEISIYTHIYDSQMEDRGLQPKR